MSTHYTPAYEYKSAKRGGAEVGVDTISYFQFFSSPYTHSQTAGGIRFLLKFYQAATPFEYNCNLFKSLSAQACSLLISES